MNQIKENLLESYINENNVDIDAIIDEMGYDKEYLSLPYLGKYYKFYLLLTHFQDDLARLVQGYEKIYIDRYYWFTMFAKELVVIGKYGEGMKQYRFQLLESITNSNENIDWELLASIDKLLP